MTQKNPLAKITIELFNSPTTFQSTDFITAYNYIYKHCTSTSPRYEIKGREIYDQLLDMINDFTSNMMQYGDIKDLFCILQKYETSINLLKKVFHYLERFFIHVSIDKRDGYVMDIRTLCFTSFYRNYLEKTELKMFELLIFEIDNFKSTKCEKIGFVKFIIAMLKNLYTTNDEDIKFKRFIKSYIFNISDKIKKTQNLNDGMDYLFKKIKLTNLIFDPYFISNIRKKLIKSISKRSQELVELFIERMITDKSIKDYYNCIVVLEAKDLLVKKIEEILKSKVKTFKNSTDSPTITFKDITCLYETMCEKIKKQCANDSLLIETINKQYAEIDFKSYSTLIQEMHDQEMQLQTNILKVFTLTTFLNFLNSLETEEILIYNFQSRLLSNTYNVDFEKYYISNLNKSKYFTLVNKLNRCIRDIGLNKNYFVAQFKNTDEIDIEYQLLTQGFWRLSTQNITKNRTLLSMEAKIKEKLGDRLADKTIGFNYTNSAIVLEFNGYELQLSTIDYLVLSAINNEGELSLQQLDILLEYNSKETVQLLHKNLLITCEKDVYKINRSYNDGDLNLFKTRIDKF